MNRISYIALCTLVYAASAFGCRVQFINDLDTTVFAFDENYNEGNIIEPGKEAFFGEKGRHPVVTFYIYQVTPSSSSFKKSYKVNQIQCALNEEDKIVRLSAVVKNELDKEIYEVTNLATGMEALTCCHHGDSHEMAIDEPLSTMDEE